MKCQVCGRKVNHNSIETHHLIPRRFDGPEEFWNRADMCANCHRAIEGLYDEKFWAELGKRDLSKHLNSRAKDDVKEVLEGLETLSELLEKRKNEW